MVTFHQTTQAKSNEREFVRGTTAVGGVRKYYVEITCSECQKPGEVLDHSGRGIPGPAIGKLFHNKGRHVGNKPKHDLCSECASKHNKKRKRVETTTSKEAALAEAKVIFMDKPAKTMQALAILQPEPPAEQPSQMQRKDKQIIFIKLTEVYLDEERGYQMPWTDVKVAEDLGVPVAWVALVREADFGSVKDNGEIRDALARIEKQLAEAKALNDEAKQLRDEGTALAQRANSINNKLNDMTRSLDHLATLAARIAKSMGA